MRDVPLLVPDATAIFSNPELVHEWHVDPQQEFGEGVPLVTIETNMAQIQILSRYPGMLKEIHVPAGYRIEAGTVLATLEVTDWVYENQVEG